MTMTTQLFRQRIPNRQQKGLGKKNNRRFCHIQESDHSINLDNSSLFLCFLHWDLSQIWTCELRPSIVVGDRRGENNAGQNLACKDSEEAAVSGAVVVEGEKDRTPDRGEDCSQC